MKIIDCAQNTPEWFSARCGIPTASEFDRIITLKGEPSKQRLKYAYQLAGERITGAKEESYQNLAMIRGNEMEAEARSFYELRNGVKVNQVGFCTSDGPAIYGCSPDGFVGKTGLIEIKCPTLAVHVGYLIDNDLPDDYFQQVHGQMLVTDRKWCDFMSYYPGMKPFLIRVHREETIIKSLRTEIEKFCAELDEITEKIR